MRLGAHLSTAGNLLKLPERAHEMGCEVVQFFAGSPRTWKQKVYTVEEGEQFFAACTANNITPFIHMLYLTSYGTTNKELRQKSIDGLGKMLITADTLGCVGVITHLGSHNGDGAESRVQAMADGLVEAITQSGEGKSFAILENSAGAGGNMGNSLEELADIYERTGRHPRIKFCLDTAHLIGSGIEFRTPEALEALLTKFDTLIGLQNLVAFHLNDSKADLGSRKDRHENIGLGFVGDAGFKPLLTHPKLKDIAGIAEVPGLDNKGPDKPNLDRLKKIAS
ncbi:MAG TPA: deoxyribonuclease IV [Candidatus Saccharimonadales bacterium]|nr:deoxyribonuclease IV [Candidatus Saccharimonadales bacterium]